MTKKRFTIVENHKNYLRVDDKTKRKFYLNEREIVECLNNLHEENEQLKSDVYDWKASAEDYLKLGKSLKKENEQLKGEVIELREAMKRLMGDLMSR